MSNQSSPDQPSNGDAPSEATASPDQNQQLDTGQSLPGGDSAEEIARLRDQWLRSQAELDNVRKRAQRDLELERKYANAAFVRDLLPAIDNLERAVQAAAQSGHTEGLLQGVQMVLGQLEQVLQSHGCQRIGAVGDVFDPNFHDAMGQEPSGEYDKGLLTRVMQPGYLLHDRVVRPAQVFVSSGGPPSAPSSNAQEQ